MFSSFQFQDEPFKRMREEMDQLQTQYAWSEHVFKGAGTSLNDCYSKNIIRELEKLVQLPKAATLEEENAKLKAQVADLANEMAGKSKEIRRLNKARLFENDVKTNGHISVPKVVAILVEFNRRMELTLAEMQSCL